MLAKEFKKYLVDCASCGAELPVTVEIDPNKKAKEASFERSLTCPVCNAQLIFRIDQPLADNAFILKSLKKID